MNAAIVYSISFLKMDMLHSNYNLHKKVSTVDFQINDTVQSWRQVYRNQGWGGGSENGNFPFLYVMKMSLHI